MTTLQAIALGFVQGATEFLPVSSSGHLVILQTLFGIEDNNVAFAVLLHAATLIAIIGAYYKSVWSLIVEFLKMLGDIFTFKGANLKKSKYRYYIVYIIVASIPAGIVGVLFQDFFEAAFNSIYVVCITLFFTGLILVIGERVGRNNTLLLEEIGPIKSFIVGICQMCAILPGISRSGTTMTGGLLCGLKKEEALEFSFLMAIPTILGSVVLKLGDIAIAIKEISIIPIVSGFVTALIIGYLSITLFKKIVQKGSLMTFCIYCWAISIILALNIGKF